MSLVPDRAVDTDYLLADRAFQGLTPKMERYCFLRFHGASQIEAYREAYAPQSSKLETMARDAVHLEKHPKVIARINQMIAERDSEASLVSFLTRDFVINGVMGLAISASKETVRLQAYITLGKTVGLDLFRETTRVERVERTPADVDRELAEQLKTIKATIEGEARVIDQPQAPRRDRRRKPGGGSA